MQQDTQTTIPCNLEAEQIIIGSLIANNEYYHQVEEHLQEQYFYHDINRRIFLEIKKFLEKDLSVSLNSLLMALRDESKEEYKNENLSRYLIDLLEMNEPVHNLKTYANLIYDCYLRRSLIDICRETIAENKEKEDILASPEAKVERIEHKLFNLAVQGGISNSYKEFGKTVKNTLLNLEKSRKLGKDISGIPCGLIDLDKKLGGFNNSDLLILAARPSMGKTALAVSMALNCAKYYAQNSDEKGCVAFFSLEMSAEQLATRSLAVESGVNSAKLRIGNISDDDFVRISISSRSLEILPIYIDDTPALTISALRTRARRLKRMYNLRVMFIDYLQLMRGSSGKEMNRVQEIGEISQGLKAIAKELNIPVIALSQLSRAVETRDDKRPQLSDLRESGNIEQDADVVMFIYRDEYYHSRKKPINEASEDYLKWQQQLGRIKNMAEVIVAKQRNGPVGNIKLRFDSDTTKFDNLVEMGYIEEQNVANY